MNYELHYMHHTAKLYAC